MKKLCNEDPKLEIKVECFCYAKKVPIGEFYTNWESLLRPGRHDFSLKMADKSTGEIKIEKIINDFTSEES